MSDYDDFREFNESLKEWNEALQAIFDNQTCWKNIKSKDGKRIPGLGLHKTTFHLARKIRDLDPRPPWPEIEMYLKEFVERNKEDYSMYRIKLRLMVKKSADIDTPLYDALDKLGDGTLQVPTLHPDIAGDENVVAVASVLLHLFKNAPSDDSEIPFMSIRTAGEIVGRNKYQGSIILETLCEYGFISEHVKGKYKKRETDEDGKRLGGYTATTFRYTGTDEIYDRTQVPKVTQVTEVSNVTEETNETQRGIGETDNINDSVSPLTASQFESEILEHHSLCEREGITGCIRRTQIAAIIARYVDGNGEDIVDKIMELIKAHKLKTVTNELRLMLEESSGRITLAQLESDLKDS